MKKYNRIRCIHCGTKINNMQWYINEICRLLKVPPSGKNIYKKPFWSITTKSGVVALYEKVRKLVEGS